MRIIMTMLLLTLSLGAMAQHRYDAPLTEDLAGNKPMYGPRGWRQLHDHR